MWLLAVGCGIGIRLNIWGYGKAYITPVKPFEFEGFKKQAGLNAFTLSPKKWINATFNELIILSNMENLNSVLIMANSTKLKASQN